MEFDVKVKSLHKALKILECFSAKSPELGITQISEMLHLNKSNVHNIVSTFEQNGYLEKNKSNDKYRLGMKMLEFSYIINEHLGYQRSVYNTLRELAEKSNTMVYFGIPKRGEVLYLCNAYPPSISKDFPYRSLVGEKAQMYCTAIGKAMLAFLPAEEAEQILGRPKIAYTDKTVTDENLLRAELEEIRRSGYSLDRMEHEYGIHCIGVPLFLRSGALLGAISMSGPIAYFTEENTTMFEHLLKEAAFQLRDKF